MRSSVATAYRSEEINSLDSIRPRPAKAELPVNASQSPLRGVVSEVIRAVSSQKAAAEDMQIDPAQLTRQLQSGHLTLERLEALGPSFAAKFGEALIRTYGPLADPRDHARKQIQDIAQSLDQLRQFIDHL